MKRGATVRVDCQCGAELQGDRSRRNVECECGAVYTVTVTQLRGSVRTH